LRSIDWRSSRTLKQGEKGMRKTRSDSAIGFNASLDAFFERFPFFKKYFGDEAIHAVPDIFQAGLGILDRWGYTHIFGIHQYGYLTAYELPREKRFYILDSDGNELAAVKPNDVIEEHETKSFLWWSYTKKHMAIVPGETVYEALKKLPDINQVGYIIEVDELWWERGNALTVYKVPAKMPFADWLSHLKEAASENLRMKISQVDAGEI